MRSSRIGKILFLFLFLAATAGAAAIMLAFAGCGWVYPPAQDPAAVRAADAAAGVRAPLRSEDTGDASPLARAQPMTPAARLLAHEIRIRLDTRTLRNPASPQFEMIEIYVAALDAEEYAAAREMYSAPEAAAALFRPDTAENRERFHRQSMGSAETLQFQPDGAATTAIARTSPFWAEAANKNAVGLFLAASLPGGVFPVRLLSLDRGAWPGRRVDLSLASAGWNVLSAPGRGR